MSKADQMGDNAQAELRSRLLASRGDDFAPTLTAIRNENQLSPSNESALQLLSVLGVRRESVMVRMLDALRQRVLTAITSCDTMTQRSLLESSYEYLGIPELAEIPLALLNALAVTPPRVLEALASMPDVWPSLPERVRRATWERNPECVLPICQEHITAFVIAVHKQPSLATPFAAWSANHNISRETRQPLEQMITMFGRSLRIYELVVFPFLRESYAQTKDIVLCLARMELAVALKRASLSQLDPLNTFACSMEACTRANATIDGKMLEQLHLGVANVADESTALVDLGMLVAVSRCFNAISTSILARVERLLISQTLPSYDPHIPFLTQLLCLSISMRTDGTVSHWPMYPRGKDPAVYEGFYPLLTELMILQAMKDTDDEVLTRMKTLMRVDVCWVLTLFYTLATGYKQQAVTSEADPSSFLTVLFGLLADAGPGRWHVGSDVNTAQTWYNEAFLQVLQPLRADATVAAFLKTIEDM